MKSESQIREYWEDKSVASMYDKNLINLEIGIIADQLKSDDVVLDLGCGEGEGTICYSEKVKKIIAVDYSQTRLDLLAKKNPEIESICLDMKNLSPSSFENKFDVIITQRSLINLTDFSDQIRTIKTIHSLLKDNGRYVMLEGFKRGAEAINRVREQFELSPINVKWHNLFFDQDELCENISDIFSLREERRLSTFLFLTRVVNAIHKHPDVPKWNDEFNNLAFKMETMFPDLMKEDFSRLKMLVFEKK